MTANIGAIDRTLRIIFGAAILSTVVVGPKSLLGLLGLVPLLTGLAQFCPAYQVMGVDTCKRGAAGDQNGGVLDLFLLPGDLVCDFTNVPRESDHRQVLRSFINTIVWSAVASGLALWAFV